MGSANPPSPLYFELWNELFDVVVKPVLVEDLYNSDPMRGLPPRLGKQSNDKRFYPFIYDQIIWALEAYCRKYVLPQILHLKGTELLSKVYNSCMKDVHIKTMKIWRPVLTLEYAYLNTNRLQTDYFQSLERRSGDVFRRVVYYKIADPLREAAYQYISDDFFVWGDYNLKHYLSLLYYNRSDESKFFDEEWNIPAHSRLMEIIHCSFKKRRKHLQEFLSTSKSLLTLTGTVFQFSKGEYDRSIRRALSELRDDRIFGNDAEEFKMILDKGDGRALEQIFNTFEYDKEFPKILKCQASRVFSELVHGKGQIPEEGWLKEERIFQRLFLQWLRLKKILERGDKNEKTIHETLIIPLLAVINNAFPDSEAIMKVLAEYSKHLLSRVCQRHLEVQLHGIAEIKALISLCSYLPTTEAFHDFLRVLLSKKFLEGTSAPLRKEQLPTRRSFNDQADIVSDIFGMLDDATTWPSYECEMSPVIENFQKKHGKIDVESKIVRRSRWDLDPDIGLVLPHRIQLLSRTILQHLHAWHPMRCASLHSSGGKMTIKTSFWTFCGEGVRIKLTTAQGCVLTLFKESDELPLQDVAKSVLANSSKPSGFNAVVAITKSMMTEQAILSKQPQNSEFWATDIIFLNRKFQPETEFIMLPEPEYSDESPKDMQATVTTVMTRYHKLALEAAVMKVLKQEREMELHHLEEMVFPQLGTKGNVSTVSFQEVIEHLERDEYLSVDKTIARYID